MQRTQQRAQSHSLWTSKSQSARRLRRYSARITRRLVRCCVIAQTASIRRLIERFDSQQHGNYGRELVVHYRRCAVDEMVAHTHKHRRCTCVLAHSSPIHTIEHVHRRYSTTRSPATFTQCTHRAQLLENSLKEAETGAWC